MNFMASLIHFSTEHLDISNNQLKRLPWDWKRLRQLKMLDISGNKIRQLPNPMAKSALFSSHLFSRLLLPLPHLIPI